MDSIKKMPDGPEKTAALEKLSAPRNGTPLFAQRLYVGRDQSKAAVVNLSDRQGKIRLRMVVDSLGNPRLDFLDAEGKVTYSLPNSAHPGAVRDR
jgi:hypothetical protein